MTKNNAPRPVATTKANATIHDRKKRGASVTYPAAQAITRSTRSAPARRAQPTTGWRYQVIVGNQA